ncbi:unnamed protein product [Closterium sp. NIES-53]
MFGSSCTVTFYPALRLPLRTHVPLHLAPQPQLPNPLPFPLPYPLTAVHPTNTGPPPIEPPPHPPCPPSPCLPSQRPPRPWTSQPATR